VMPTFERVNDLLHCDAGVLTWRVRRKNGVEAGDIAGGLNALGYWVVGIDHRLYLAHRVVWILTYGKWPEGEIDHIDGNRLNNRIENLRDGSCGVNEQNRKRARSDSTTGLIGVKPHGIKFQARIWIAGKRTSLGYFATPELAHKTYLAAKRKHHLGNTI
jgi:hypothetical protein